MAPIKWMPYPQAHAFEAEAARLRVSQVARSSKGFMREYERAGTLAAMRQRRLPSGVTGGTTWGQKNETTSSSVTWSSTDAIRSIADTWR